MVSLLPSLPKLPFVTFSVTEATHRSSGYILALRMKIQRAATEAYTPSLGGKFRHGLAPSRQYQAGYYHGRHHSLFF